MSDLSWEVILKKKLGRPHIPMLQNKSQGHPPSGSGEEDFQRFFYYIWARRPSWSCNQDHFNKLLFPRPKESPYEIWA